MTIRFTNVGRDKKSWTAQVAELSFRSLMKEIKARGALMSNNVDFDMETGEIIAGFRAVGKFTIDDNQP